MRNHKRFIRVRLRNVGLTPRDARAISERVAYQLENQGEEETVRYLKRCGDTLLWAVTGSGQKSPWVRTKDRYPVMFQELKGYPEDIALRVAKLARCIRLEKPTNRQVGKVRDAVITPLGAVRPDALQAAYQLILQGIEKVNLRRSPIGKDLVDPYYPKVTRQFRRVQSVSGPTPLTSCPPIVESLEILASWPAMTALPSWSRAFYPFESEAEELVKQFTPTKMISGEIHAAQEGGGKLRMYASPYTVLQCLISPLHDWLDQFRQQLATDCTYDQLSGASWAQVQLRLGKKVFSVDLSTATCRFPLSLQMNLLHSLECPSEWVTALRDLCTSQWKVGHELRPYFRRKTMAWKVGQPLGIRPSMSLFSLTHNLLLAGICSLYGFEPASTFRVLGDDVVIAEESVARHYMSVIESIGVPISWDKTHEGYTFAEFAGASITPVTLLRPGQFRPVSTKNWETLALDLKRPLKGEVSIKMRQAQKLVLFNAGLWTPPSESYSVWLKRNTLWQQRHWSSFRFAASAPLWEERIQVEFQRQLDQAGLEIPVLYRLVRVNLYKEVMEPLASLSSESTLRVRSMVEPFMNMGHVVPRASDVLIWLVHQIHTGLALAVEEGLIALDRFSELVDSVTAKAQSLLYLPPRSNRDVGWGRLEEALRAIREASEEDSRSLSQA